MFSMNKDLFLKNLHNFTSSFQAHLRSEGCLSDKANSPPFQRLSIKGTWLSTPFKILEAKQNRQWGNVRVHIGPGSNPSWPLCSLTRSGLGSSSVNEDEIPSLPGLLWDSVWDTGGLAHNACSTTKVVINSCARKRSPVSRINVFRRRGQSSWKYQDKNQGTVLKKRIEGISLHDQAVLEETPQPQAETCTMWAPPASLSSLHSRMERTEHTHPLFRMRIPRIGEAADVLESTQPAVLFHSREEPLIGYTFYDSVFQRFKRERIILKVSTRATELS